MIMEVIDRFVINYLPVYLLETSDVIRYRTTSLLDDISDADPKNKKGRNKSQTVSQNLINLK